MKRVVAVAASVVLAMSTLALAQNQNQNGGHHPPGRPGAGRSGPVRRGPGPGRPGPMGHGQAGPGPGRPIVVPGGGRVGIAGPGPHAQFFFRGRSFHPVRFARPFVYPPGWGYDDGSRAPSCRRCS
jgi:hypothetical protein